MRLDLRLALPAVAAWLSAGLLIGVPAAAGWSAVALWVCAPVFIKKLPLVTLCLAAAALLASVVAVQSAQREPASLVEAASSGLHVEGAAVVTQTPADGRAVGTLDGRVPVVLFAEFDDSVRIGSRLDVGGTVTATEAGDDAAFLFFASAASSVGDPPWFLAWADNLRDSFGDAASALPGDGARLLPGLAIGDTSAVTPELDAAMKASSLSHLTAVSGANCAIVVGLIVVAGRYLGLSRTARTVAAAVVLVAFVILVTPEPSVLRAAAMALLVLGALASGRPVQGVPVLALAILVLLVADPWLSRNYGFALSVLATGGLLLLANPLAAVLSRWLPLPLATVVAVPLAAQLCCQPVLILLQPSIPTWGVVANVLAEPAAPVATVVGLAACVALPLIPWLGHALALLAWLPAAWIAAVATFFARLPFGAIPWPGGAPGLALLALLTALLVGFVLTRRRWLGVAAALTVVGLLGSLGGARLASTLDRPADWQIAMCDVGQGDATLIRSAGQVALIDTGPDPALLDACLGDLGIQHIDLLVLTHFDADHIGGADAVLGRVGEALVGPGEKYVISDLLASGAHVTRVSKGVTGQLGDLRWQVLWPTAAVSAPGNDASVTLLVDCVGECLSALLLGDLSEQGQSRVLAANRIPEVDVVKVAHHGSADQDSRTYEQASATVGIIGVGAGNDYGHPNDSLLATLAAVGTAAIRTDTRGLILLAPSPEGVVVWTAR